MSSYIYFGQYKGFSSTSMAIRSFTRSDISHTSIFTPCLEYVYEAVPVDGVRHSKWSEGHLPNTEIVIYRVPCTPGQQKIYYDFARAQVGRSYDYQGVFGFGMHFIKQDPQSLFCSEYFLEAAFRAGLMLLDCYPSEASPRDVQLIPNKELVEVRVVPGELPKPETLAEYKARIGG